MGYQANTSSEVTAVPGFGFYPSDTWKFILEASQENRTNQELCQTIQILWEMNLSIHETNTSCRPLWDTVSCIPSTPFGTTSVLPCIEQLDGKRYNKFQNISRDCSWNGTWAGKSNYNACKLDDTHIDQSSIYLVGYSVSIVALFLAIFILLFFKGTRSLRHKIHMNLFATFLVTNLCWILQAIIQHIETQLILVDEDMTSFKTSTFCSSILLHRYFHLATFFWMFIEGLYLFLQVQATFSFSRLKFRHCLFIGWGSPVLITLLWSLLIICHPKEKHEILSLEVNDTVSVLLTCPFLTVNFSIDILTYSTPVCILLFINFIFLTWIMVVVISKLKSSRSTGVANPDFHLKAFKALLIISPLLGITYMMTIVAPPVGQEGKSLGTSIYTYIRAFILSFQGFFITLPYCFLNGEVCQAMRNHLETWRIKREIEQNRQVEPRNSLVTLNRTLTRRISQFRKNDSLNDALEMNNMESTVTRLTIQEKSPRNASLYNQDRDNVGQGGTLKDIAALHDGEIIKDGRTVCDDGTIREIVAVHSDGINKDIVAIHGDGAIKEVVAIQDDGAIKDIVAIHDEGTIRAASVTEQTKFML